MNFTVKVPGSCGELVQGFLNGYEFLINAPIPFYAEAKLTATQNDFQLNLLKDKGYLKTSFALENCLKYLNPCHTQFNIEMKSSLPRNKGLSSSTAEISAALIAVNHFFLKNLHYEKMNHFVLEADISSDAVFLEGVTHINQLTGHICHQFIKIPNLSFIIVDVGGEIETQKFDRKFARWVAKKHEFCLKRAVKLIQEGFEQQSPNLIAEAATISAKINQYILHKSPLETLLLGTHEFGGLGVNCAHTGTVLGVMFDHTKIDGEKLKARVKTLIHPLPILGIFPLISGGAKIILEECYNMMHTLQFLDSKLDFKFG